LSESSELNKLRTFSYLAPNLFWFYKAVTDYLGRSLAVPTEIRQSQVDPLADPLLFEQQLDLAFICGLPLVRYHQMAAGHLQAIAAPVMQASRYHNRPVYFADLIVRVDNKCRQFAELAGKTFCYNDFGSNSGYNLVRQRLIQGGHPANFFGQTIPSRTAEPNAAGSHQTSIRWVAEGLADCAAIDSTVLEQELLTFPQLANQIRILESLGPCPIPPIAVSSQLEAGLINQLQTLLLHPDLELQAAMAKARVRRFAAVGLEEYQAIADIYTTTLQAGYEQLG
jgi:phosphonate transport system substrate-binding protein